MADENPRYVSEETFNRAFETISRDIQALTQVLMEEDPDTGVPMPRFATKKDVDPVLRLFGHWKFFGGAIFGVMSAAGLMLSVAWGAVTFISWLLGKPIH